MKKLFALGAMLLLLASCLPEEEIRIEDKTPVAPAILHASVEKETDPDTKVYIDSEDCHIYWDAADEIAVYYKTTGKNQYRFLGKTGDDQGDFQLVTSVTSWTNLQSNYAYAVYPCSSANSISKSGLLSVNLPAEQSYRAGSFGKGASTMVSSFEVGSDNLPTRNPVFKNVGGYICFRLYGASGVTVSSITLTGNNGEPLAGDATVGFDTDGAPTMKWGDQSYSTAQSITLVCDPPVAVGTTKTNATEFWMAVPPTEFTNGFTFTIRGGGGVTEKRVSVPVSVLRNRISTVAAVRVPYDQTKVYSVRSREKMSLWEKVGQLFMVVDNTYYDSINHKTSISSALKTRFAEYPCGGFILKAENVEQASTASATLIEFTQDLHNLADYPLLSIDEEGGNVARIGNNKYFGEIYKTNKSRQAGTVGATGDPANAYASGNYIGTYLRKYGLDINLAPVADVNSNPDNPVINIRSFGSDPYLVANMVEQFLHGLQDAEVEGCLKHFPGHGDTKTDSHYGYAEVTKTWQEMLNCEIIPFKQGIKSNARMIMTAHITIPKVDSHYPSTLSSVILQEKLRKGLGYTGVIITDAMGMGAITNQFDNPSEAAILAILAGADIVLGPANTYSNFKTIYKDVFDAVKSGRISEDRINESVDRILALKRHILSERGQLQ